MLVDCLTLWLTNVMLGEGEVEGATGHLVTTLPALPGPVVLVTNEVGGGIVPDNALARRSRDAQGWLDQRVAAACDTVVLVAAGLPLLLKPGAPTVSLGPEAGFPNGPGPAAFGTDRLSAPSEFGPSGLGEGA